MLKFNRKEFKSGTMIIEDRVAKKDDKGKEIKGEYDVKKVLLRTSDKGKDLEFSDEDHVLKKYPSFFKKV